MHCSQVVATKKTAFVRQITMMCSEEETASVVAALNATKAMSVDEVEAAVSRVLFDEQRECWLNRVPRTHTIAQKEKGQPPDDSATPFAYKLSTPFTLASLLTREFLHFDIPATMRAE